MSRRLCEPNLTYFSGSGLQISRVYGPVFELMRDTGFEPPPASPLAALERSSCGLGLREALQARCDHASVATVSPRSRVFSGGGDTAAAMGILSSGFRAKIFFSLWWSVRSWLLSFPPNACRGERCGVWGRRAPSDGVLVGFFWSVSSSSSGRAFFLLGQSAIRKRTHRGIGAYMMTYSGREEERAPSIYRSSSLVALSGGVEGAPFQRVFLRGLKSFSSRQSFSFDQRFS